MNNMPELNRRCSRLFFVLYALVMGLAFSGLSLNAVADQVEPPVSTKKLAAPDLESLNKEIIALADSLAEQTTIERLIAIDDELAETRSPAISKLRENVLRLLAKSGREEAIAYVRSVFETDTEHRDEAAFALSEYAMQKPKDLHIWRFLIRSLTVVEGKQAVSVMKALKRYRQKATNPRWVRRVVLIGLRLPEKNLPAVLELLDHWTDAGIYKLAKKKSAKTSNKQLLAEYQNWFRKKWQEELDPSWPVVSKRSRWGYVELKKKTSALVFTQENVAKGKQIFVKIHCAKCHRKGDLGEKFGPNLSDIAGLRQRQEILEAILFPSLELNEDYPTVTVLTKNGITFSGLMSAGKDETLHVIGPNGKKNTVKRSEIETIKPSKKSNMLVGTLDELSFQEICDLLAFIEHRTNPKQPFHKPAGY